MILCPLPPDAIVLSILIWSIVYCANPLTVSLSCLVVVDWTGLGFYDSMILLSPCTNFFKWEFIYPNILNIIYIIWVSYNYLCDYPFKLPYFKLLMVSTYYFSWIFNLYNYYLLFFSIPSYSNYSMLITGWFINLIDLHLSANLRVE